MVIIEGISNGTLSIVHIYEPDDNAVPKGTLMRYEAHTRAYILQAIAQHDDVDWGCVETRNGVHYLFFSSMPLN